MANLDLLTNNKVREEELEETNLRNSYGMLVLIAMGLAIGSITLHFILLFFSWRIAVRPAPTLVQLASGESVSVVPIGSKERTPEAIQKFVKDTMAMAFNWSGSIPNPDPSSSGARIPDEGVSVQSRGRITTPAYEALFAFEGEFRQEFMGVIAELTPSSIFTRDGQVAFVPIRISDPRQVAEGQWKVTVISNLLFLRNGQPVGDLVPFNKEIYVRAVEPPTLDYLLQENDSVNPTLAETITRIRNSGLEITAILDYRPEELILE